MVDAERMRRSMSPMWRRAVGRTQRAGCAAAVLAVLASFAGCSNSEKAPLQTTPPPAKIGVRTHASITSDDTMSMAVHVTFPNAVSRLSLAAPEYRGDDFRFEPEIRDLHVLVDKQPSQILPKDLRVGATTTVSLPVATKVVVLKYEEVGGLLRTKPSSAGRAIAWLAPLTVTAIGDRSRDRSSTVTISGSRVLNLGCAAPGDPLKTCGSHTPGGWRVGPASLPNGHDVYAQVDLPPRTRD